MAFNATTAEIGYITSRLAELGIHVRPLDEAAALDAAPIVPPNLVRPPNDQQDAMMRAVIDNPAKLEAVVRDIAYRNSGAATAARRLLENAREARVADLAREAVPDVDKALAAALRKARPELEAAEADLPRHGLKMPRLTEYDVDGEHPHVIPNVGRGELRQAAESFRRRDGGAALAAVDRFEDAMIRFNALVDIVRRAHRAGMIPEHGATCGPLANPVLAPPDAAERFRRTEAAAKHAGRAFSQSAEEKRQTVYTGRSTPERLPR